MPITALLVECAPDAGERVAADIERMPEAEVHRRMDVFLTVVADTASRGQDEDVMRRIAARPGVITATPVFTNTEDLDPSARPWEV